MNERGGEGHRAPGQQQAEQHPLRAPGGGEAARGDLQDDVAPEKHPGGETQRRGREAEIIAHERRGHRQVHPVDMGEHIHHEGDAENTHPAVLREGQRHGAGFQVSRLYVGGGDRSMRLVETLCRAAAHGIKPDGTGV